MKIAKHFRAFLEQYGYLQVPGIGKFEITSHVVESEENLSYNRRLLQFHSGNLTLADCVELISFLRHEMHVETCIIESDLEYFGATTKELLMQGLEAEVPGIGYLNYDENNLHFSNKSRYHTATIKTRKFKPAAAGISFWF